MEETIRKIIEADKQARAIVDEARQKSNSFDSDIKNEMEELTRGFRADAQKEIDEIREIEDAKLKIKLGELMLEYAESVEQQEKNFAAKKELWIDNMYSAIVNPRVL